jgi:hypothetical protein
MVWRSVVIGAVLCWVSPLALAQEAGKPSENLGNQGQTSPGQTSAAGETPAKPRRKKGEQSVRMLAELQKKIELSEPTEEQKAKLKTLAEEYKPKFIELNKKYEAGIPEEIRKQLAAARKELAATGVKGKNLASALAEKIALSEEHKKIADETNSERAKLQSDFIAKVTEILTPEQLSKAGIKAPKMKKAA